MFIRALCRPPPTPPVAWLLCGCGALPGDSRLSRSCSCCVSSLMLVRQPCLHAPLCVFLSISEVSPGRWALLGVGGGCTCRFDFVSSAGGLSHPPCTPWAYPSFCALHVTHLEQDCFSSNPNPGLFLWASQAALLNTHVSLLLGHSPLPAATEGGPVTCLDCLWVGLTCTPGRSFHSFFLKEKIPGDR